MFNVIRATHYRGGTISWRIIDDTVSPLVMEIFQRHAWRYTFYSPFCTGATIPSGQPVLGSPSYTIDCVNPCPTGVSTLGTVEVPCTGFNIGEQYAMGEGRFTVNIPENASFVAVFSNVAWFALFTGSNLPWSVAVQIQTFKRYDTRRYNNAPVVTMLPIYRLRDQLTYALKINVADNDFDPYICLWSEGPLQCGGLSNSVPGGIIDSYACYIYFTPNGVGFYAAALTVEDFIISPVNLSSTDYLSQVPIQFVFHVYDSPDPCYTGPIYIGDLEPDICIYIPVGETVTTRVRFQVQCPGATVDSIISVNPTGLLTTGVVQDSFDPSIFAFLANFTSNAQQVGQNLFCFAAVDSIGNQGNSSCLRFTVASQTSSLQPLYIMNSTRWPMGTVTKTTSGWTIITTPKVYKRPTFETYIRFKRKSDDVDFYVLNAVTATDRITFLPDRIIINSTVVWTPGESFYIYFDAGVLVEAVSCSKDAMPISDPNFWPFNIPYESTTTSTSTTTTTSVSSTTTARTIPTRRTLGTSTTTTSTSTSTTTTFSASSNILTSSRDLRTKSRFPISGIVAITITCLLVCSLVTFLICSIIRIYLIHFLLLNFGLREQIFSIHLPSFRARNYLSELSRDNSMSSTYQYKIATRHCRRQSSNKYSMFSNDGSLRENLVDVEV